MQVESHAEHCSLIICDPMRFKLNLALTSVAACVAFSMCVCAVLPSRCAAQSNQGDESAANPDRIAELVDELDDPATPLIRRRQAEQELISIGVEALSGLDRLRSPSGRQSANRVRKAIEVAAALEVGRASSVDLRSDQTLSEAFASLEAQTGNRYAGIDGYDDRIDFTIEAGEYWPTLDRLLDLGQLEPSRFSRLGELPSFIARNSSSPPRSESVDYQGAFRIDPLRVETVVDRREPSRSRMTLRCEIAWEPRVQPVQMQLELERLSAVDEQARAIPALPFVEQLTARLQPNLPRTEFAIPFEVPLQDAKLLATLEGEVDALLLGPLETFAFSVAANEVPKTLRQSSVEVELKRVIRDEDEHQIHLAVRFDKADVAFESHQDWVFRNPIQLLDANQQSHNATRFELSAQDDRSIGIVYFFDPAISLDLAKLEYRTPIAIVPHKIKFTLKDIRLP